jgi:predicted phosphoribosyltransferase
MFGDRADAGKQLGNALSKYRDAHVLVLAIPCGGVEVGFHVAMGLNADLSIIVSRKLPFPHNPESGFGAIAEDGSVFMYPGFENAVSPEDIAAIVKVQRREIKRRIAALRGGLAFPSLKGRTVVLVDDGIAMGSTMRVSIAMCTRKGAEKLIAAAPVAGKDTVTEMAKLVDEVVVLETPPGFRAVAEVYRNWYDVSDREVLAFMAEWDRIRISHDSR